MTRLAAREGSNRSGVGSRRQRRPGPGQSDETGGRIDGCLSPCGSFTRRQRRETTAPFETNSSRSSSARPKKKRNKEQATRRRGEEVFGGRAGLEGRGGEGWIGRQGEGSERRGRRKKGKEQERQATKMFKGSSQFQPLSAEGQRVIGTRAVWQSRLGLTHDSGSAGPRPSRV